ncbi:hypothetical protein ACFY8W_10365 [Streptomyces sp. NPDC012637]|uniref:hypothetical protein n=1 Tax=Streptomyces sp. NPDC012637 TaxID=3364842 RepID=UPI0036E8E7DD
MATDIDIVSKDIADLKKALLENTIHTEIKTPGDHEAKDSKDRGEQTVKTTVSALKQSLMTGDPKIVTDNLLPFKFVERFAIMYEELQKEPWTEYLEGLGLGGFAAAFEKYQEAKTDETIKWQNWLYAALGGMVVALVVPVLALVVASKFTDLHRSLQAAIFRRDRILAFNENGQVRLQRRTDVEARERRVANGGTSLADLVGNETNVAQTRALREQLEKLNPEVLKFNGRAPAFIRDFGRLPSESKATKAANAIKTVSDTANGINHAQLEPVAKGVAKIRDAVRDLNPRKVEKVAKAVGKLKDSMVGFDPKNLPKSSDLGPAATKMSDLATATGTLRTKFEELRGTITNLDTVIGASAAR